MQPTGLSRFLGWFSLGLGTVEVLAPRWFTRTLGLSVSDGLIRAFGVREIGAGLLVLSRLDSPVSPAARVAGDALDLAVLAPAMGRGNDRQLAGCIAFGMVLGVTVLDLACAAALARGMGSVAHRPLPSGPTLARR